MKKTIFLSLVAGAVIFAGCGGGGGGSSTSGGTTSGGTTSGGTTSGGTTSGGATSGGTTSGGTTSGGTTSGGAAVTYSPYAYPAEVLDTANVIAVNADGKTWTVTDGGTPGDSGLDKTYAAAEQFCQDKNQVLPSAKDLLTTAMLPNDGTTAAWAKGKFIAFFTDKIIGQSSNESANELRKVICMEGTSVEKKHEVTTIQLTVDDNNGTMKQVEGIKDTTTGLSWTPVYTYDKDTLNPGHANQSRFPRAGATAPQINAAAYCQKFGAGWRLPTLAEVRTIAYLDGTTSIPTPESIPVTVLWTNTPGANAGTYYTVHLNPSNNANMPYYSESPEAETDDYYVSCVNDQ